MADPTPQFNIGDTVQLTNTMTGDWMGYGRLRGKQMIVSGIRIVREVMGRPLTGGPEIFYELNLIENNVNIAAGIIIPEIHLTIVRRAYPPEDDLEGGGLKRRTKRRRINKKYSRKKRYKKKRSKKKSSKKKR